MRPEEFRNFLRRRPFQPFRLTLTDGRTYDVLHPEMAMVGRSTIVVGIPGPDRSDPIYDHTEMVSLLHVMQIEPLETMTTS